MAEEKNTSSQEIKDLIVKTNQKRDDLRKYLKEKRLVMEQQLESLNRNINEIDYEMCDIMKHDINVKHNDSPTVYVQNISWLKTNYHLLEIYEEIIRQKYN